MNRCLSNRGIRLTFVRLIEVFLWERHLCSAGTCESVRLREVSVVWDVRLQRFYCNVKTSYTMTSIQTFDVILKPGLSFVAIASNDPNNLTIVHRIVLSRSCPCYYRSSVFSKLLASVPGLGPNRTCFALMVTFQEYCNFSIDWKSFPQS